jgi:hypothetical protein
MLIFLQKWIYLAPPKNPNKRVTDNAISQTILKHTTATERKDNTKISTGKLVKNTVKSSSTLSAGYSTFILVWSGARRNTNERQTTQDKPYSQCRKRNLPSARNFET